MASLGATAAAEWAVAARPIPGEHVSGDRHVAVSGDRLVVAVIDGLGHGPDAAHASARAAGVLEAHPGERPDALLRRCHEELRSTRGAAITIASIDEAGGEMTWVGVGNVQAAVLRSHPAPAGVREWVPLRGGVVGYLLPSLRPGTVRLNQDDVIVFATDGVRPVFGDWPGPAEPPGALAARILEAQGRDTDDALVFVARYRGGGLPTKAE
ncbi:MAG TPA: SpoIIE family protein phosphatase [Gaiellales bacterium]|nr:SpoIIE family protein phosphatase [Gaiellales bacterium]